jgi:signal transduction histidine kinase
VRKLTEALSPFEATHRGFRETNVQLQQLNAVLGKRNCELENEITEKRRAEEALRQSGVHYRQLFNEAQTMQENLRNLSNKVLYVQEEERKHISRELHDEVGQALTAISVTFATMKNNGAAKSGIIRRQISDSECLLQETMERVHCFARELRPAMLDELGLLPALRSHLNGFARRTGLRVHFRGSADAEKLGGDQKTVLFRVAQESLTNVAKHAKASRVDVSIRKAGNGICLEVKDDGKSFREKPETSIKGVGRLGLLGMQERARLVNGTLTVKARLGKGTTICVMIPFASPTDTCI